MTNNRLLTFELSKDEDTATIHADSIGLRDLIGWLSALPRNASTPATLRWRTPALGGIELTEVKQGKDTSIIHEVSVTLWRGPAARGEQMLATFEITPDGRRAQIHCDTLGLDEMLRNLTNLFNTKRKQSHDHWMTPSWAGHELTEQRKGDGTVLINKVDVYYWP
jgi:hypothetical protein